MADPLARRPARAHPARPSPPLPRPPRARGGGGRRRAARDPAGLRALDHHRARPSRGTQRGPRRQRPERPGRRRRQQMLPIRPRTSWTWPARSGCRACSWPTTPGCSPARSAEQQGILRHAARMFAVQHRLQVPKLHVTLRKAFGFGSSIMAMNPFDGQTITLAFPSITLGALPASSPGSAITDPESSAWLRTRPGHRSSCGSRLSYDDVIDPRELRNALLAGLTLAEGRDTAPRQPRSTGDPALSRRGRGRRLAEGDRQVLRPGDEGRRQPLRRAGGTQVDEPRQQLAEQRMDLHPRRCGAPSGRAGHRPRQRCARSVYERDRARRRSARRLRGHGWPSRST